MPPPAETAPVPPASRARVKATGRIGSVVASDPSDKQLTYKLEFTGDGAPSADWFAADKVELLDPAANKEPQAGRAGAAGGALIFLHGSGDSGEGVRLWLEGESGGRFEKALRTAGIQVVYPDAPEVPYTLNRGHLQAVWFDRKAMAYEAPEDVAGVASSVAQVDDEIDKLVATGIPVGKIGVAGMSMGGCLALHVGYGAGRHAGKLGLVASLSTFLPVDSALDEVARSRFSEQKAAAAAAPPLFMAHGAADPMVKAAWAVATRARLEAAGVPTPPEVILIPNMGHTMCAPEVQQLTEFIVGNLAR